MKYLALCLLFGGLLACRHRQASLFRQIAPDASHIHFNNKVTENDSINPLDMEYLYNGGGVAVADFNRDGLPDLYFTAGMVSNRMYLNKGHLTFEDVTAVSQVDGGGRWCNGASIVDINNDGWPDIYICTSVKKDPLLRTNLLYINQGLNPAGIPVFREMAKEYGLADTSYSVQAAFFDYDNDGDLDMYLVTTKLARREAVRFSSNDFGQQDHTDADKLYRNDWNGQLHHPVFTDVSAQAGIVHPGYGLGISISDINRDGWPDIYVSNDFLSNDLLYINNRDGTFTDRRSSYLKHTSQNAMGNDIADINNDGLEDIFTVDMAAPDNLRKKKNMGGGNYTIYQNMLYGNYALQYVRNTLQLNLGARVEGDSTGAPVFADIGFMAGVAETDWSWNPSLADMDNDGYRDILITNGYPRDVTDHDFSAFRAKAGPNVSKQKLIAQIPGIRIPNYAFRNMGDLHFSDVTSAWGLDKPSFSTGAVYVDLDNDGDLDYVVNNINSAAFVYENTLRTTADEKHAAWLDIRFKGSPGNIDGLGAIARIYYAEGQTQIYENYPVRGYLSTVAAQAHFGMGETRVIDSIVIAWPGGLSEVLRHVHVNQVLTADIRHAHAQSPAHHSPAPADSALLRDITSHTGINYTHHEVDHIDFNTEKLLPHKLSQYGPSLSAGDLDGNGLDDIFIGTSAGEYIQRAFLQMKDGRFVEKDLPRVTTRDARLPENLGTVLFDVDGDGLVDIYCASGSNEYTAGTKDYEDRLWMNIGHGNFALDTTALPLNNTSKGCVKAGDIDNDGDLDLFIGGRVLPGSYPMPVSSCIYRNDSRPGHPKFTDVTATVAPGLDKIGMVCDAIWTDFDNDGWPDLIVVGEWMHITFFRNIHGKLTDISGQTGLTNDCGWWNSIAAGDFDNDGDIDYIVGNLGLNSFYKAIPAAPLSIYAKDLDNNGSLDAIITAFLPDPHGIRREFPVAFRDEMMKQLPALKKKFLTYKQYGLATFSDIFSKNEFDGAFVRHADNFSSCYLENLGNGKFSLHTLPTIAQTAPIYGLVIDDFNADGNLDIACNGNDYGVEVGTGRCDAFNGLLLLGDGKGGFQPQTISKSGLYIPGDGKALIHLRGPDGRYLLAASQNGGSLKIFTTRQSSSRTAPVRTTASDRIILRTLTNGKTRREEIYYGSSFLSQSSVSIVPSQPTVKIQLINTKGEKRTVF